jgi:hypothetical protein
MRKSKAQMVRVNLYLSEKQWEALNKVAEGFGISASELLRRWIDERLEKKS